MSTEAEGKLRNLVSKFKRTDKDLLSTLLKKGFNDISIKEILGELTSIYLEIKEILGYETIVHVADFRLKEDISRIQNHDSRFAFFRLHKVLDIDLPNVPLNYEEIRDILHEEIHDQVLPNEIIRGRMQVGTLLLGQHVPHHIQYHLDKIRTCYCFNFHEAASIWCRSLLEIGLREALRRKGVIRNDSKIANLDERDLRGLISNSHGVFDYSVINKMKSVQRKVNMLLHSEDINAKEKMDHLQIIKDTFYILEHIFQ